MNIEKKILDPCCGTKAFYFDKDDERVLFCDIREECFIEKGRIVKVAPDLVTDFRAMPFDNGVFDLVIFDPPHRTSVGENSWMFHWYGRLPKLWKEYIKSGFDECWRVLRPGGTLIFKWSEKDIKINQLYDLFPAKPIIGTRNNYTTIFIVFYKNA